MKKFRKKWCQVSGKENLEAETWTLNTETLVIVICDLEFLITLRPTKFALTNRIPLGIVSANEQQYDSSRVNPALPEAVKVGFSFAIVICVAEKKIFLGYNFLCF